VPSLFIDGAGTTGSSGETSPVIDPFDGSEIERVDVADVARRGGAVWPHAEWGGFRQSGIGRELSPTGLDEYPEARHIYQDTATAPSGWFAG